MAGTPPSPEQVMRRLKEEAELNIGLNYGRNLDGSLMNDEEVDAFLEKTHVFGPGPEEMPLHIRQVGIIHLM